MIKDYIGVPFSNDGPSLKGANCITLCELFYREELGVDFPRIRIHSNNTRRSVIEYLKQINENFTELKDPEEYCVVAMRNDVKHPKMVQHFSLYIGNGKVLHTLNGVSSHIVNLKDIKYFVAGYYKLKARKH